MSDHDSNTLDFASGVPLAAVPEGGMLAGRVGDAPVLLVRLNGVVNAFGGLCPHLGAPLAKGLCADGTIRCPWHHARFDMRTGEAVTAPAFDPLPARSVEQRGALLFVGNVADRPAQNPRAVERAGEPGIVIVGGGAAGYAAAHQLRARGHTGQVTMVSADGSPPYDRTLLTKDYLDGRFGADRLSIARTSLDQLGVRFLGASAAAAIEPRTHVLHLEDGRRLPYTRLLLATGAEPNRLDVPGAHRPHVRTLRSLADCRAVLARLTPGARVVVVGSSFIGLEAAASIRSRGFDVTVATPEDEPMAKILGRDLSRAILSAHTKNGVVFRTRAEVQAITEEAVHLADGSVLPADVVVVGIGVKPRLDLAKAAGLRVDEGVVVDRSLQTSAPDIFAAGDIAQWPDARTGRPIRVEHWAVAEWQGQTAARNMLGETEPYAAVPFFWSKHFDFSFRYLGHAEGWDEAKVEGDLDQGKAVVRYLKDGREVAVATVGDDLKSLEIEKAMEDDDRLRRERDTVASQSEVE